MHVNIKLRRCGGMSANETTLHPSHNVVKVSNFNAEPNSNLQRAPK